MLRGLLDPPQFALVRIGGADVVEAAELLDHRAIKAFAAADQAEADSRLRGLPERQEQRRRYDAGHDQAKPGLFADDDGQSQNAGQDGGEEVEEAQPQEAPGNR